MATGTGVDVDFGAEVVVVTADAVTAVLDAVVITVCVVAVVVTFDEDVRVLDTAWVVVEVDALVVVLVLLGVLVVGEAAWACTTGKANPPTSINMMNRRRATMNRFVNNGYI